MFFLTQGHQMHQLRSASSLPCQEQTRKGVGPGARRAWHAPGILRHEGFWKALNRWPRRRAEREGGSSGAGRAWAASKLVLSLAPPASKAPPYPLRGDRRPSWNKRNLPTPWGQSAFRRRPEWGPYRTEPSPPPPAGGALCKLSPRGPWPAGTQSPHLHGVSRVCAWKPFMRRPRPLTNHT